MQRLCKNCKWWERYNNINAKEFGRCDNGNVIEKVESDDPYNAVIFHESFGCNFWEKRDEKDLQEL